MKRFFLPVLVLLVLCGCAAQPEPTEPKAEPTIAVTAPATEPDGIYDADSTLEKATGGAIRAYPLSRVDSIGIAHMGSDLLLFSGDETTTLTKYSGDTLYVSAGTALDLFIRPEDPAVQISENGITYYDARTNELVFLDAQLEEVRRISLPGSLCGTPALSADRRQLYYCTADALRCIDLETGLDRLVKELYFSTQTLAALHCDDTVIVCDTEDRDGNLSRLFLSAENGMLLWEDFYETQLYTNGAFYFAVHQDGAYEELLIGDSEIGPTLLTPHTYGSSVYAVPEICGAVLVSEEAELSRLDFYDLPKGKRTSSITIDGCTQFYGFHGTDAQTVWFLCYDSQYECQTLCRWDLSGTLTDSKTSCFAPRYTAENPDYVGLADCREIADNLSDRYGVQILLWADATAFQPWDYTLVPEYQVCLIEEELKALDEFLALYPEGFLEKAAARTDCGRIQICLVRSIFGNATAEGALQEAAGLQYWDDRGNTYLCLSAGQPALLRTACHEMFHIIESRVMTVCKAYDDWNDLNPKGFRYDNDYVANLSRDGIQWLEGEDRAFIDTYSMSYPKEDRARIMEYAMTAGNEAFFESETMQRKLRQLCLGIREAFELKDSTEAFIWEQYLKEPLAKS